MLSRSSSGTTLAIGLVLTALLAACGGTTTPPRNEAGISDTASVGTSTTTSVTVPTIGISGITSSATLPAASSAVTITETISTTPPDGASALSAARAAQAQRQAAAVSLTAIAYIEFSASGTVTLNGEPGISFTLPSITPGDSYYLAAYVDGAWDAPAAGPATVSGTTVSFAASTSGTVTITTSTPIIIALYATTTPTPTPTPTPVPTPVVSPAALLFDADAPSTQNVVVSETGDTAAYTAAIVCVETTPVPNPAPAQNYVAQLPQTSATPNPSGAATFGVQGGGDPGTCTVTITDSRSATATVSVAVDAASLTVSGKSRH
ncbi:MAG: hypothetical protein ABSD03_05830 [Vulcanimicrobiaceae bacterium]|jgi:hypothetical protein